MARFRKGVLGGFSGKVGNVVGSNWKGQDVMRSLPRKSSKPPTQKQLDQQEKLTLVTGFLSGLSELLTVTFDSYSEKISSYNAAMSYNLQNAISGSVSPFNIDYAMALLSRGDLVNASAPTAVPLAGNEVKFSWSNNTGLGNAKATDKAVLVIHCPGMNQSIYVPGGAARSALTQTVDASLMAGETVETWISFVSENGKKASNSFYTGTFNLLP